MDQTISQPVLDPAAGETAVTDEQLGAYFWSMLAIGAVGLAAFIARGLHRLPVKAVADGVSPLTRLVFFFALMLASWMGAQLAAILIGIKLGGTETPLSLADETRLTMGVAVAQGVVVVMYAVLHRNERAEQARRCPTILQAALIGLGAIAIAWPIVAVVAIFGSWLRRDVDPLAHETLRRFTEADDRHWLVPLGILVVLVGPILEEFSYRGLLQRSMTQSGLRPWPAIMLTSLLFALMHLGNSDPQAVAALFVLSLALGWAYEKSGSLLAPIVMHAVFNLANLVLAMWLVR